MRRRGGSEKQDQDRNGKEKKIEMQREQTMMLNKSRIEKKEIK